MTKSDKIQQKTTSTNLNKIDLKLKNLDSYNNERLLSATNNNNNNNNNILNTSDFVIKNVINNPSNVTKQPVKDEVIDESVKYGELVVIGYNGYIPKSNEFDTENKLHNAIVNLKEYRHKSKFELRKREVPNGVKPTGQKTCSNLKEVNEVMKDNCHSVTYTLSRNEAVIVKYTPDSKTDMFQIGRSCESSIDFIVLDTPSRFKDVKQSTISRFSCRIIVERNPPYTARIYAAGFDGSKHIFLGEKATKWKNEKGELDGITTNGILIMHPLNGFSEESKSGDWVEVSVCGAIFRLDNTKLIPLSNNNQLSQANILKDGTLIDLCGATLLWRSTEGLAKTATLDYIEKFVEKLENTKIVCPISLETLHIKPIQALCEIEKKIENFKTWMGRMPTVPVNCGHVQGTHDWGVLCESNTRVCPVCREIGPVINLEMGVEPSFYCDIPKDSCNAYAFNPCGHMASEKTCKYWSEMRIPQGTSSDILAVCPFCAHPLHALKPYLKLIFSEDNIKYSSANI